MKSKSNKLNKSGGVSDGSEKVLHSASKKWKSRLAGLFKNQGQTIERHALESRDGRSKIQHNVRRTVADREDEGRNQQPENSGADTNINLPRDSFAKKTSVGGVEIASYHRLDGDRTEVPYQRSVSDDSPNTSLAGKAGTVAFTVRPVQDPQDQQQAPSHNALQQAHHSMDELTDAIIGRIGINHLPGRCIFRALRKASKQSGIVVGYYPVKARGNRQSVNWGRYRAVRSPGIVVRPGDPLLADVAIGISFRDKTARCSGGPLSAPDKNLFPFLATLGLYHGESPASFCFSDASQNRIGFSPQSTDLGRGQNTSGPPSNAGAGAGTNPGTSLGLRSTNEQEDPQTSGWWICPLFRINPRKHMACLFIHPKDISKLKDHICRNHAPHYCPICLGTFANAVDQQNHILARACESGGENVKLDGLTGAEVTEFKKLRLNNDDAGWIRMWRFIVRGRNPTPRLSTRPHLIHDMMKELQETIFEMFLWQQSQDNASHLARDLPAPLTSHSIPTQGETVQNQQEIPRLLQASHVLANLFNFATTNPVAYETLPAPITAPAPLSTPLLASSQAPQPIPTEPTAISAPTSAPTYPLAQLPVQSEHSGTRPSDHSSCSGLSTPVFSRTSTRSTFTNSANNASRSSESPGTARYSVAGVAETRPEKRPRTDQSSATQSISSFRTAQLCNPVSLHPRVTAAPAILQRRAGPRWPSELPGAHVWTSGVATAPPPPAVAQGIGYANFGPIDFHFTPPEIFPTEIATNRLVLPGPNHTGPPADPSVVTGAGTAGLEASGSLPFGIGGPNMNLRPICSGRSFIHWDLPADPFVLTNEQLGNEYENGANEEWQEGTRDSGG